VPARNIYHDEAVEALQADGWTITADPFRLSYGERNMYVDLGAERTLLAAQRGPTKIAVEIHSFLNPSPVRDLQEAVGQYGVYRAVLREQESERVLYMGVSKHDYDTVLTEQLSQFILSRFDIKIVVFDYTKKRVCQWTS
jgi:XisH protein